jgi:hypothetical protein
MPPKSEKPTYIEASEAQAEQSMLKAIWTLETTDPDHKAANIKALTALGLFAGGIAFLRFAGDLITPTF